MAEWSRIIPIESNAPRRNETWILKDKTHTEQTYSVEVRLGKPIDILTLKSNMVEDFGKCVSQTRKSRLKLFSDASNLEHVEQCPICESGAVQHALTIYGASYIRCKECSHHFLANRPTKEALAAFYSENVAYQSTYADERTTETRVRQVAMPKLEWTLETFRRLYGRDPRSILDVGAGSGHFVYACRQSGIHADGIELSEVGRAFCKDVFGFELLKTDFTQKWGKYRDYDVITFWGVIEHTPYPLEMLAAAAKILAGGEGLVVAEVPRWNCLGTAIQSRFKDSVVRHLEPLGHINCFTDSSLATSFRKTGFDIVAAWYFGMDAYELVMQLSYASDDPKVIQTLGPVIPALQQRLDLGMLSDEIVLAGKPGGA